MRALAALVLSCIACAPQPRPVQPAPVMMDQVPGLGIPTTMPGPQITYLANEGVMLTWAEQSVLIDGLHRPYKPEYAVLDEATRGRVERAEGALAAVVLVLVSHVHRDHFDAEAVRLHLRHNPRARLIASAQVVAAVTDGLPAEAELRTRVGAVTFAPGTTHRREVAGISVELIGLPHAGAGFGETIHNLGHIVTFGGQSLLHVGDTALDEPALAGLDLPARGLDVAFLPYWYFLGEGGLAAVQRTIGAKRYYAVHVPPNEPGARDELARVAPGVTPLTVPWSPVHD